MSTAHFCSENLECWWADRRPKESFKSVLPQNLDKEVRLQSDGSPKHFQHDGSLVLSDPIQEQHSTGSRCSKPPPKLEQHLSLSFFLSFCLSLSLVLSFFFSVSLSLCLSLSLLSLCLFLKFAFRLFSAGDRFYSALRKQMKGPVSIFTGPFVFGM